MSPTPTLDRAPFTPPCARCGRPINLRAGRYSRIGRSYLCGLPGCALIELAAVMGRIVDRLQGVQS